MHHQASEEYEQVKINTLEQIESAQLYRVESHLEYVREEVRYWKGKIDQILKH